MSPLRTYAYMNRKSEKVKRAESEWQAVYRVVTERSGGRCECNLGPGQDARLRCTRLARDHHHLVKPRRAHHDPKLIVHLCRHHHDRCEWPYKRGRLVISMLPITEVLSVSPQHIVEHPHFFFDIAFAADKFEARNGTWAGRRLAET